MLDAGADYLLIRKPAADEAWLMAFIEQIPFQYADRIFTSHFRALHELSLGGFHFSQHHLEGLSESDLQENLNMLHMAGKKTSRTVRSLEQLKALDGKYDLLLLAPLFESISKAGHRAEWDFEALKVYLQTRESTSEIFALGGISASNVDMVALLGFDGVALLGAVWQDQLNAFENFSKIAERCRK